MITKRQKYSLGQYLHNELMPADLEYVFFEKEKDLIVGTEVYAEMFAGKRRGLITEIIDKDIVLIDGQQTFVSDIKYTIAFARPEETLEAQLRNQLSPLYALADAVLKMDEKPGLKPIVTEMAVQAILNRSKIKTLLEQIENQHA